MNSTKKYIHQAEAGKMYEPKYVLSEKIGSQMIVVFSDKNYENFMGAIVFQRGVTGLWRPTKAQFETGPVIQSISTKIKAHRMRNYFGKILLHHTLQSSKYLGKWIEEKQKNRE